VNISLICQSFKFSLLIFIVLISLLLLLILPDGRPAIFQTERGGLVSMKYIRFNR